MLNFIINSLHINVSKSWRKVYGEIFLSISCLCSSVVYPILNTKFIQLAQNYLPIRWGLRVRSFSLTTLRNPQNSSAAVVIFLKFFQLWLIVRAPEDTDALGIASVEVARHWTVDFLETGITGFCENLVACLAQRILHDGNDDILRVKGRWSPSLPFHLLSLKSDKIYITLNHAQPFKQCIISWIKGTAYWSGTMRIQGPVISAWTLLANKGYWWWKMAFSFFNLLSSRWRLKVIQVSPCNTPRSLHTWSKRFRVLASASSKSCSPLENTLFLHSIFSHLSSTLSLIVELDTLTRWCAAGSLGLVMNFFIIRFTTLLNHL